VDLPVTLVQALPVEYEDLRHAAIKVRLRVFATTSRTAPAASGGPPSRTSAFPQPSTDAEMSKVLQTLCSWTPPVALVPVGRASGKVLE
jgi:hypothetical protein